VPLKSGFRLRKFSYRKSFIVWYLCFQLKGEQALSSFILDIFFKFLCNQGELERTEPTTKNFCWCRGNGVSF